MNCLTLNDCIRVYDEIFTVIVESFSESRLASDQRSFTTFLSSLTTFKHLTSIGSPRLNFLMVLISKSPSVSPLLPSNRSSGANDPPHLKIMSKACMNIQAGKKTKLKRPKKLKKRSLLCAKKAWNMGQRRLLNQSRGTPTAEPRAPPTATPPFTVIPFARWHFFAGFVPRILTDKKISSISISVTFGSSRTLRIFPYSIASLTWDMLSCYSINITALKSDFSPLNCLGRCTGKPV